MKPVYTDFVMQADVQALDASKRACIIAAAIAVAVANTLPLPTGEVDNPASQYALVEQANAARLVAEFNENLVFDMPYAIPLVRSLWLVRYTAAHPAKKPMFHGECGFFDSLLGVSHHVDSETCTFLNENKAQILVLASAASDILAAMAANGGDSGPGTGGYPEDARMIGVALQGAGRPF